jgi:hypothetical protein
MTTARKADEAYDEWMTLGAAARALATSRQTTLTLIVKGELEGKHLAGQTFVRRATVEQYLAKQNAPAS